jgi:hypothetical protein
MLSATVQGVELWIGGEWFQPADQLFEHSLRAVLPHCHPASTHSRSVLPLDRLSSKATTPTGLPDTLYACLGSPPNFVRQVATDERATATNNRREEAGHKAFSLRGSDSDIWSTNVIFAFVLGIAGSEDAARGHHLNQLSFRPMVHRQWYSSSPSSNCHPAFSARPHRYKPTQQTSPPPPPRQRSSIAHQSEVPFTSRSATARSLSATAFSRSARSDSRDASCASRSASRASRSTSGGGGAAGETRVGLAPAQHCHPNKGIMNTGEAGSGAPAVVFSSGAREVAGAGGRPGSTAR